MYGKLAKMTAEYWVKNREIMPLPAVLSQELSRQRACYVSVFENPGRKLRFFYGNVLPRYPLLAQEIIVNTASAITSNGYTRIRRVDLPHLVYSVALLGTLQRISSEQHLDPLRYGLYLMSDRGKSALILSQRAGIDTPADQVATALREANINLRDESVTMYRFAVEYFDV